QEPHVSVQGVGAVYETAGGSLTALSGIDLTVGQGEFVSILGPSGCGKSTLLRIIGGLQQPSTGEVAIDGQVPKAAQGEKTIGVVFQAPTLLPWRTVLGNVQLPLEVHNKPKENPFGNILGSILNILPTNPPFDEGLPGLMLDAVGLSDFWNY